MAMNMYLGASYEPLFSSKSTYESICGRFIMSKEKLYGIIENLMVLTLRNSFSLLLSLSVLKIIQLLDQKPIIPYQNS